MPSIWDGFESTPAATKRASIWDGFDSTTPTDYAKSLGAGALSGAGMIAQGGGELLARGVNAITGDQTLRAMNPLQPAIDWLHESMSPGAKQAIANTQLSGDLTDASTWNIGTDPSLKGLALQGLDALGQFAPNLAIALSTGGASLPWQFTIGATVGGMQALGGAAQEEREKFAAMKPEELAASSLLYREMIARNVPHEVAKNAVAEAAALSGGLGNAIPSAAEGGFENLVISALSRGRLKIPSAFGKSTAGRVATGAIGGAATGGLEEAVEQVGQNIGSNIGVGGNRPITADTFQQFVMGAMAEGPVGGGAGFFSSNRHLTAGEKNEHVTAEGVGRIAQTKTVPDAIRTALVASEGPLFESDVAASTVGEVIAPGVGRAIDRAERTLREEPAFDQRATQLEQQKAADLARMQQEERERSLPPSRPDDMELVADSAAAAPEMPANPQMRAAWGKILLQKMEEQQRKEAANAVQEPVADAGVLRQEGPAVGLPQVGSGNAAGQPAAAQGQATAAAARPDLGGHAVAAPVVPNPGTNVPALSTPSAIDAAAHQAAPSPQNKLPEPTEAQKEVGNYQKGHARVSGLDISIENPAGSKRRAEWPTLQDHYGYIRGVPARAPDKEHVDVFVKPGTPEDFSGDVYVVDQKKKDGSFDEPKVVIGAGSLDEARSLYLRNYTPGWDGVMGITPMPMATFKEKLQQPRAFLKPHSEPVLILGKRVDQLTNKVLEVSAKKAKTKAQREAAAAELDRRQAEAASRPLSEAEQARRAALSRKAQDKKKIDVDRDSLIPAIIKLGGIKTGQRKEILGQDKGNRGILGVGYLFTPNGQNLDTLALDLSQYGYISEAEIADRSDTGGVRLLSERIEDEFAGRRTYWSTHGNAAERQAAEQYAERDEQEATAVQAAAAEMGASVDLTTAPDDLEAEALPTDAETIARAELGERAERAQPGILERLAMQHDTDEAYWAAVVQFLKEHDNAIIQPDAAADRIREEARAVSGSDVAKAAKPAEVALPAKIEKPSILDAEVSPPGRFAGGAKFVFQMQHGSSAPVESVEDAARKWIALRDAYEREGRGGVSQIGNGGTIVDRDDNFVAAISYNGRIVTDPVQAKYMGGDIHAFRKDAAERIKSGRADGNPEKINTAVDERVNDLTKRISDSEASLASSLEEFKADKEKQKAGVKIAERDDRFSSWREYFENSQRVLDFVSEDIERMKKERAGWEAQRVRQVEERPALVAQSAAAPSNSQIGGKERPALELATQTEQDLRAKEKQAETGTVEQQTPLTGGENEPLLSSPSGTAPPRDVAEQKVPTSQQGLFGPGGEARVAQPAPAAPSELPHPMAAAAEALVQAATALKAAAAGNPVSVSPPTEKAAAAKAEPAGALAEHDEAMDRVRDGQITLDEFKAAYEKTVANRDQILAELSKLTKDQLNRRMGVRYNDPKERLVRLAYSDVLQDFTLSRTFSYTMGSGSMEQSIADMVAKTTEKDLADYAERVKAARAEREAQNKEMQSSIENPQTLEDFLRFIKIKGEKALTDDQRRKLDELAAAKGRERRAANEAERSMVQAAGEAVGAQIVETKHTKKGHDLFVVQLEKRVEREDYNRLNVAAKRLGGYYSSFRGSGAVPGFQFTTRENAEAFQKLAGGDTQAATEAVQERRATNRETKKNAAAERLAEMADRMEQSATERMSADRLTNTARRARQAESTEAQARADEAMAKTLRAISDAIEEGKATNLDGIRTRKQVEELDSILRQAKYEAVREAGEQGEDAFKRAPRESDIFKAKYPQYRGSRSDFAATARSVAAIPGSKMAGEKLLKMADDSKDYAKDVAGDLSLLNKVLLGKRAAGAEEGVSAAALFRTRSEAENAVRRSGMRRSAMVVGMSGPFMKGQYAVVLGPAEAKGRGLWHPKDDPKLSIPADLMEEIMEKVAAHNDGKPYADQVNVGYYFDNVRESRKRLKAMGIENLPELRAALREYLSLRTVAREADKVKSLERALAGAGEVGFDFFPTPAPLAVRMAEALELQPGMTVLEPSAGKGNLADAVREAEPGAEIDVVEQSSKLREILTAKGYTLAGHDFMEFEPEQKYDRIIMNPPFSNSIDADHVQRAYEMLNPGGRLVAIAGEGIFSRQDAKAKAFREWFDQVGGTSEEMEGAFTDRREVRTTGVNSRLLIIDKPAESPAFSRATKTAFERTEDGPVLVGHGVAIAHPSKWETRGKMEMYEHTISVDGQDVGRVTLGWEGDKVVFLPDIRLYGANQNKGTGERVLRAILEHNGQDAEPLVVGYITDSAKPFWRKMGVRIYDTGEGEDGAVDLEAFRTARPGGPGESPQFRRDSEGSAAAFGENEGAGSEAGEGARQGLTADAIRRQVASILRAWGNAPEVRVIANMAEAPAAARSMDEAQRSGGAQSEPEAFIYRGTVYLVTDGLSSHAAVYRALFHESLGHFGLRGVFGDTLNPILDDVARSLAGRVRAKAREYGLDFENAEQRRQAAEEVLAELAQTMPRAGVVQRLIAAIRQFLRSIGIDLDLSENDLIANYILPARGFVERGRSEHTAAEPAPAFGRDQTQSDAFRKWFGDSKVVDIDGNPLVVYHATNADFTEFKTSGDGKAGKGAYFSADPAAVEQYASKLGAAGGERIIPAYLSMKNPYLANAVDTIPSTAKLKARGFDGVILTETWNNGDTTTEFVVFRPEQIKSATGNRGTFDASNPDIRFSRPIREEGITSDAVHIASARNTDLLRGNPAYAQAKGGDVRAAAGLVRDLVSRADLERARKAFGKDALYVWPHAKEQAGYNAIPGQLASLYAGETGGQLAPLIVQANRAYHTGAGAMERLVARPIFDGDVVKGGRYVLADDVSTMGGTLAELADHIRAGGGKVIGTVLLADASRAPTMSPTRQQVADVEARYGKETREEFHIHPAALTAAEADYVARFRDADSLRARATQAKRERAARLRDQGIQGPGEVRFARAPAVAGTATTGDERDSLTAGAMSFVRDLLRSDAKFNWWNRTVGTQQHKALTNREFAPVYAESQAFLGDTSKYANESADLAQDLLPRVDLDRGFWKSLFTKSPTKDDVSSTTEALYAGTLWGGGSPTEGRIWTDEELRTGRARDANGVTIQAFKPLNEKQASLYHQALASTAKSLDELGKSLIHKFARQHDIGFDRGMTLEDVATTVNEQADEKIAELNLRAQEAEENDSEQGQERIDLAIAELERLKRAVDDIAAKAKALQDHGYFPAMRFGQYAVYITEPDDNGGQKQLYFGLFESQTKANIAARQLDKEMRAEHPDMEITRGIVSKEQHKIFQGMSLDALEAFADYITDENGQPIAKDPLVQGFLKAATSERSSLKRHIHRKGIAGYSDDLSRVLANFTVSSARATSANYHMAEMLRLANDIKAGDVKDEAIKLVAYLRDPQEEAQALRGFLFAQFLGGSIAHGLVNMTQPFMVTGPYLSQHTSVADAAAKLAVAAKTKPENLTGRIRDAYARAKNEGVVAPQEIHQLQAETGGMTFGKSLLLRKLSFLWGSIYAITEQFNRSTAFLAAYRIAEEKGMQNPYAFAKRAVEETQFVYNKGNRPNWARGAIGATAFTFKQFSISYLELMKRLYGKDKKAFALMLLVLLAAAGIEGLPFAEDIEDMVDTVGQWMGYSTNAKKSLRKWAEGVVGKDLAQVALHGMSGLPFMPVDVSNRLGLQNLIPGTGMLKLSEKNKARDVLELVGPVGQFVPTEDTQIGKALERLSKSDYYGAVKAGAPVAVQNIAKGAEMLSTGQYRDLKGKKVTAVTPSEAVLKMTGLQPSTVANQQERIREVQQDIDMQKRTEDEIAEQWARGIADKEPSEVRAAMKKMHDWNNDNPDLKVRVTIEQVRQRVRNMNTSREDRILKSAPREIREGVRAELRQ